MHEETPDSSLPDPVTQGAIDLRRRVSDRRWACVVRAAQERVKVLQEVESLYADGGSYHGSLKKVAPRITWSRYLHWRRRWRNESGPEWERLLDLRVPPPPATIPPH